ncbi:MAG: DUF262 domain-containing protein, partial [Bauldia sp.]
GGPRGDHEFFSTPPGIAFGDPTLPLQGGVITLTERRNAAHIERAARLDHYWRQDGLGTSLGREALMRDIQLTTYTVADFVSWAKAGLLELSPRFQRRPVWKRGAKSFLIDTIVRGLPMPIIFLRDRHANTKTYQATREVVDGQQRIRTILSFIDPKLLKDYRADRDDFTVDEVHDEDIAGKSFRELNKEVRQTILDYKFSVQVLSSETGDREVLQIFARMNATGLKLNWQELRNAEFYGRFKTLAYGLATEQLERWIDWRIFTDDQIARMNEVELTSEFMLLALDGVLEKNQKTIDGYYKEFEKQFADQREVASRFRATMDEIEGRFFSDEEDSKLFRNRTIFYALFASIHGTQFGLRLSPDSPAQHEKLSRTRAKPISTELVTRIKRSAALLKSDEAPPEVARASRGATAHASQRKIIIGFLTGSRHAVLPAN